METARVVSRSNPQNQPLPRPLPLRCVVCSALFIALFGGTLPAQSVINTVAGGGSASTSASPGLIAGIAVDQSGNVLLSISDHSVVMRVDAATNALTIVAGTGTQATAATVELQRALMSCTSPSGTKSSTAALMI